MKYMLQKIPEKFANRVSIDGLTSIEILKGDHGSALKIKYDLYCRAVPVNVENEHRQLRKCVENFQEITKTGHKIYQNNSNNIIKICPKTIVNYSLKKSLQQNNAQLNQFARVCRYTSHRKPRFLTSHIKNTRLTNVFSFKIAVVKIYRSAKKPASQFFQTA